MTGGAVGFHGVRDVDRCLPIRDANSVNRAGSEGAHIAGLRQRLTRDEPLEPVDLVLIDCALRLLSGRLQRQEAATLRRSLTDARDAAIGRAAAFYTGSVKARAKQVRDNAKVYAATSWRRHRSLTACPPDILGRVQGEFWLAMKSAPRFPFGIRQIETIIARSDLQVQLHAPCGTVSSGSGDGNGFEVAARSSVGI